MISMPVFILRKRMIIKKLEESGAIDKKSARTLEEAGILYPNAFMRVTQDLEKKKVIVKVDNNRYYVNRE